MGVQIIKGISFIFIIALVAASLALSEATDDILSKSVSGVRLNITSEEFAKRCQLKKQNLTENLKEARNSLLNVSLGIIEKVESDIEEDDSSKKLNEALNKHCLENFDLKEALKKLLNDVQLCYNAEDNLTDSEEENVAEKAVFAHCFEYLKYNIIKKFYNCPENETTKLAFAKCYEDPLNLFNSTFTHLLPLPIILTEAQCNLTLHIESCQSNIVKQYCTTPESNMLTPIFMVNRKLDNC